MPKLQDRVIDLIRRTVRGKVKTPLRSPAWLQRPGRAECGERWELIREIYANLTNGMELPERMPPRESRSIDAIWSDPDGVSRLIEVDESQHFNPHRALALQRYPKSVQVGFPVSVWIAESLRRTRLPQGRFARPTPPLFPMAGGRHLQRAFRDAIADLLPAVHGFAPTLRIADFEVDGWIWEPDAEPRLVTLFENRIGSAQA